MMRRVLIACVLLVSTIRVSVGENDPTQVHIHTTTQHTQSNHPTITTSHKSQSNQKTTSTTQAQKEQEMMNVHEHTEQKNHSYYSSKRRSKGGTGTHRVQSNSSTRGGRRSQSGGCRWRGEGVFDKDSK